MIRGLVVAELTALAAMWATFMLAHGYGAWWRQSDGTPNWVGRQLMAMATVGLLETASLALAGSGHAPPLWVFALVYGVTDIVMFGWLLLLWRAQRRRGRE